MAVIVRVSSMSRILSLLDFLLPDETLSMLRLFFLALLLTLQKTIFIFFSPSYVFSEMTTVKDWFRSVPNPD